MIIDVHGLLAGDRLRRCSDLARLLWPYLFLQANSYGRIELNYQLVRVIGLANPPTEDQFWSVLQEYHANFLLFPYLSPLGIVWGQWWVKDGTLPVYKSKRDQKTPSPPIGEYEAWQKSYVAQRKAVANVFAKFQKVSEPAENFRVGIGVGIGVGKEREILPSNGTGDDRPGSASVRRPAPLPLSLSDPEDRPDTSQADALVEDLARDLWNAHPKHRRGTISDVAFALQDILRKAPDARATADAIRKAHAEWVRCDQWRAGKVEKLAATWLLKSTWCNPPEVRELPPAPPAAPKLPIPVAEFDAIAKTPGHAYRAWFDQMTPQQVRDLRRNLEAAQQ